MSKLPFQTRTARLLLGGAKGALVLLASIHLPAVLFQTLTGGLGDSGQFSSWRLGVGEFIGRMLTSAFTTPWGVVGALAGLSVTLYNLRREEQDAKAGQDGTGPSSRWLMPGELILATGMLLTLISISIFPSVMVWMLALFTLPPGVILGISGLVSIRGKAPERVRWTGLAALFISAAGMLMGAFACTSLSCVMIDALNVAPALAPVLGAGWLFLLMGWGVAVMAAHRGLRTWTDWTAGRRRVWVVAVALFPVAAFLIHFSLAAMGLLPLSA